MRLAIKTSTVWFMDMRKVRHTTYWGLRRVCVIPMRCDVMKKNKNKKYRRKLYLFRCWITFGRWTTSEVNKIYIYSMCYLCDMWWHEHEMKLKFLKFNFTMSWFDCCHLKLWEKQFHFALLHFFLPFSRELQSTTKL